MEKRGGREAVDGGGGGGGGGLGVGEGVILVGEGEGSEEGLNLGLLWRWLRGWLVEEEARMTSKSFITEIGRAHV